MKFYQFILSAVLAGTIGAAQAESGGCSVQESGDAPVNVRNSPNGVILGNLHSGTVVQIRSQDKGDDGKNWMYIAWQGQPLKNVKTARYEGWVAGERVICR